MQEEKPEADSEEVEGLQNNEAAAEGEGEEIRGSAEHHEPQNFSYDVASLGEV